MLDSIQELIQAFADASQSHSAVESFDAGNAEYFFTNLDDVEFPHAYLHYTGWNRNLTRVTINFNLVVVDRVTTDENYNQDITDSDGNVVTPAQFNWNRNDIVQLDSTRDMLDGLVTLVQFGSHQGRITVGESYEAQFVGRGLQSVLGWQIPISISFESALDTSNVPTNS